MTVYNCRRSDAPRAVRNTLIATWRYLALMAAIVGSALGLEVYIVMKVAQWVRP